VTPAAAPLPPRLGAALRAVALRLDAAEVRWWVTGSCARRLLGAPARPRDLDLECAAADVAAAERALGVALVPSAGGWSSLRAQWVLAGAEVDLSAAVAAGPLPPDDDGILAAARTADAGWGTVRCAPPEEALARALATGDWGRLAKLAAAGGPPPDPVYLSRRLSAAIAAR
jgi:hypothetical protein